MNYKGHLALNATVLCGLHYFGVKYEIAEKDQLLFAGGYIFSTFFLSPDLDLFYSTASKNWKILRVLWWPYSKLMKHRGLSHSLFLSTLSKLSYMTIVVLAIYLLALIGLVYVAEGEIIFNSGYILLDLKSLIQTSFSLFIKHWPLIRYVLLGVWVSDLVHILLGDRITSA